MEIILAPRCYISTPLPFINKRKSHYLCQGRLCFRRRLSVCLRVCLLAILRKNFRTDLHEIFRGGIQWAVEQNFGGDPDHRLDTGIVFRFVTTGDTESGISRLHCVTLQCTACTSRPASAGIAIATMTSLRHRPMTDVPWQRYALSQCF